ncbi:hypothetical protein OG338_02410 [Streptomyces sp. NBC_00726]|uniref:hypothetical protein n=1 Tax=Streptomyces sp. NBC_00726 TaxID=2903674 RepID=UPI00386AECFE
MRTLTNVDAEWPYGLETTSTRPQLATEEIASRLGIEAGVALQHSTIKCLEPGGRSAMLVLSWWKGRRRPHARPHASFVAELGVVRLPEEQAHALGLLMDTVAYRVMRTRLDVHSTPVETADLILPMDHWTIRLQLS